MKTHSKKKKSKLHNLYDLFELEQDLTFSRLFVPGCSFCCTFMGNIDIVTLEGLIIMEHIGRQPEEFQAELKMLCKENMTLKENGQKPPCPFLHENSTCQIYAVRPFSCRQLYSVRECSGSGPMAHRQAVEAARLTVREIQKLDDTGYSGHISYIIDLLDKPSFRKLYLSGGFAPEEIMKFGKAHGLIINRFAK
jgi:Fe-S-cluster containining protein